jgi:hypothetical protein
MKFYVYELVRVSDGKVLYVGKGSGTRLKVHRWNTTKFIKRGWIPNQSHLYSALADLIKSGDDFTGRKIFESDTEIEALQHETDTIRRYGIENLLNGVTYPLFGLINSQKVAAYRLAVKEGLRRHYLECAPERARMRKQHKRERKKLAKELERASRKRESEINRATHKLELELNRLDRELSFDDPDLALHTKILASPNFKPSTAKPVLGRQILNFLFPSTPKTAY